ncbi:MAG: translocation/assembly module TamB domain-containing protein [Pseudoxanthomonas sp.]
MIGPRRAGEPLTAEQREERIAQLRARRKARLRKLAVRSAIGTGALLVLLCFGLYWLLQTVAGRDVLLAQIVARLPAGASFAWRSAEGPLAGPLTLRGVHFHMDGIDFSAERVYLEPDLRPLLGKRLRLDRLEVEHAVLDIAPGDEPFELPSWPEVMPAIRMPLAIQADALALTDFRFARAGAAVIAVSQGSGAVDVGDGYFFADKLRLRSDRGNFAVDGQYEPRNGYRTELTVAAGFPAARGRTPARLGLVARGDRSHLQAAIGGRAPAPVKLQLDVRGTSNPDWGLLAASASLDLSLLGLADTGLQPLDFNLQANGTHGGAAISGRLTQGGQTYVVEPSHVRIDGKVLHVAPLAVQLLDGRVSLHGYADFSRSEDPQFKFAVNARGLRWGQAGPERIGADADLGVAGGRSQWAAIGKARLARGEQQATVEFDARGNATGADLKTLRAATPGGALAVDGHLDWSPRLAWQVSGALDKFDPGYFAPGWNGSLSGQLASTGHQRDPAAAGFEATLKLPALRGSLRGRPLEAKADLALAGSTGQGSVSLALGSSRVQAQGTVGDTLDVEARLSPLQLPDLLPEAGGQLAGSLHLSGPRATPSVQAELTGSDLKYGDYAAGSVSLRGRLPWRGSDGSLTLSGQAVQAGLLLDRVQVDARGAVTDLQLRVQAGNPMASLDLSGNARQQGGNWQGALQALRIVPSKGDAWALNEAARFSQRGKAFSLSRSCLAAASGGSLCASADWPGQGLSVHSDGLPLTLVQPWLPPNQGRTLALRGSVGLDATLRPAGNAWEGEVHLASAEGGLRMGSNARGEIMRYDHFSLDLALSPQRIQGRLGTGFAGDGYVDAKFDTGWDAWAPLTGDVYLFNSRLFWLELFSPDLVRPRGKLSGHLGLAGTRGTPLLSGEAQLTEFTGELPALGIDLVDGSASLVALADGSATLKGTLKSKSTTGNSEAAHASSGQGTLAIDGSLGWRDTSSPLRFTVGGQDFLAADTSSLRLVVAPQLQVQLQDNVMAVTGSVQVPSANIDIEKLSQGVSASEDVVVLDPADPQAGTPSRLSLELRVALGEDVHMKGFGLDGTLSGQLRVRSRPGQAMAATGQLDVAGRYTAYGQKLQITRGALSWSNDEVGDPDINLRAEREVISAGVTAGIDVTGRASAPRAQVWSNPETTESDALAYLVLGRSLSQTSSEESAQLTAAQSALASGAGLLTSQLGAKIGLDDAGMLESRTLGTSVFGIGKYLSPKLYVSYGVSMVGSGAVVTLRYLIHKGLNAEIESSTVETRGSLNWRKEK